MLSGAAAGRPAYGDRAREARWLTTLAPFPALATAATVTSTLRLGTYVLGDAYRPAVQVGQETTTLQLLSDGRFELGIGAGRPDAAREAQRLGVAFGSPGQRISQLARSIRTIRDMLDATPRPPILIAGAGPRLLQLAAAGRLPCYGKLPEHDSTTWNSISTWWPSMTNSCRPGWQAGSG